MADRKAVIKNADMSEEMQQDAVDCATQALEKYNIEKVQFLCYYACMCGLYLYWSSLESSSHLAPHELSSHIVFYRILLPT